MTQRVMRVGVAPHTHMHLECYPSRSTKCSAGPELDLLEVLAALMDFEVEFVLAEGNSCGLVHANGTYTGLMEKVRLGKVDILGNLCSMNRLANIDQDYYRLSSPVWQFPLQFVIQTPRRPPMSFAPLAPFSQQVWLSAVGTLMAFIFFLAANAFANDPRKLSFASSLLHAGNLVSSYTFNFMSVMPAKCIWIAWLLFVTSVFLFYNTYVLSAVLHPIPVYRPFSNTEEFVDALAENKYKLVTEYDQPIPPDNCIDSECREKFHRAIQRYGTHFVEQSTDGKMFRTIANQERTAAALATQPRYVAFGTAAYISVHMSAFVGQRDNLWIIDDRFQRWNGYVVSANFTRLESLNYFLAALGDFKYNVLARYAREQRGPSPVTGMYVVKHTTKKRPISMTQIRGVLFLLMGGIGCACIALALEFGCRNFWTRKCSDRFGS